MSAGLGIRNPWQPLTKENVTRLPATLGVFELADLDGRILLIGYAGGRSLFGLRSTLAALLVANADKVVSFRVEQTMQYISRWKELLMVHKTQYGVLPPRNGSEDAAHLGHIGQLAPGARA